MAVTLVSGQIFSQVTNHWVSSASAAAKDLPVAATVGNLIIVIASIGDPFEDVLTIDDAGTTTYARANRQSDETTGNVLEIWWGIAAGTNPGQDVVVTKEGATDNGEDAIIILEFAGNDATQASLSVNGATTSGTTSHDSGSVTPGTADNVLIAISRGSDREWTVDADFTTVLDNARTTVGYKIQSANTSQSYTATSDTNAFAVLNIVAFKGAAAGGTVNTSTLSDAVTVIDQFGNFNLVRGFVGSDGAVITDGSISRLWFTRLLSEAITISEGPTIQTTTINMLATDEVDIIDGLIRYARYTRLISDDVVVTDTVITSVIGYLIFVSVLTSNVTVTDNSLVYRLFNRMLDDGILTADQGLSVLLVVRDLLDSVEVQDSSLTAMQRFILLTDAISIDDSLAALYIPVTGPAVDNPIIRIGFDQPQITFGGYGLH